MGKPMTGEIIKRIGNNQERYRVVSVERDSAVLESLNTGVVITLKISSICSNWTLVYK